MQLLIGITSLAIALAGVVVTYILYRASIVGPRPVYRVLSRLVSTEEVTELRQQAQSINPTRLKASIITLWNSGRATVDGKSIVKTDPLRIEFDKHSEVLKISRIAIVRPVNRIRFKIQDKSPNRVLFWFDYLDPGDGVVVKIFHTDAKPYPEIRGTIRGVPKGLLRHGQSYCFERHTMPSRRRKAVPIATIITAGFFLLLVYFRPELLSGSTVGDLINSLKIKKWVYLAFGSTLYFTGIFFWWLVDRKYLEIPKGLRNQENEDISKLEDLL